MTPTKKKDKEEEIEEAEEESRYDTGGQKRLKAAKDPLKSVRDPFRAFLYGDRLQTSDSGKLGKSWQTKRDRLVGPLICMNSCPFHFLCVPLPQIFSSEKKNVRVRPHPASSTSAVG